MTIGEMGTKLQKWQDEVDCDVRDLPLEIEFNHTVVYVKEVTLILGGDHYVVKGKHSGAKSIRFTA